MSTRELLPLLLDDRVAIQAIVVREATITACSEAAKDLLDAEPGRPLELLFDDGSRRKLARARAAAPTSCELQARRDGHDPVPVRLAVLPLDAGEQLLLVSRTGVDYADRVAQQLLGANDRLANLTRELSLRSADLDAARARFEALAELREHFVSMLAHDLRGALHGILLGADAAEQAHASGSTERMSSVLARIRNTTRRVVELVETVLEAARTETGEVTLDLQTTSLRAVVQDALDTYLPLAEHAGVRLELIASAGEHALLGDRVRLGQVAGNVIENAIRHSPRGGTVTVEIVDLPQAVRIAVRDEGPGVPPRLRDRIFERFVRDPGGKGSLGLGLHVAHQLARLHGGRIWIEDGRPPGATFVIELPRSTYDRA